MTDKKPGGVTGKGFTKGDPRINRKGRPKSIDALRELAQEIAHETAQSNGKDLVIHGHKVTNAEAILRKWLVSGNPQLQKAFMEIAFGKVPDNMTGDVIQRITVEYVGNENSEFHEPANFD